MRGLRRQTALVTAASMGIGAAIAAALADQRVIVSSVARGCDAHAASRESYCHVQRFASVDKSAHIGEMKLAVYAVKSAATTWSGMECPTTRQSTAAAEAPESSLTFVSYATLGSDIVRTSQMRNAHGV